MKHSVVIPAWSGLLPAPAPRSLQDGLEARTTMGPGFRRDDEC
jgi:hypothetical protein